MFILEFIIVSVLCKLCMQRNFIHAKTALMAMPVLSFEYSVTQSPRMWSYLSTTFLAVTVTVVAIVS